MSFTAAAVVPLLLGPGPLVEASGVVVHGDHLRIISDDAGGAWYEAELPEPGDVLSLADVPSGGEFEHKRADDVEGIEVLADGRMVMLSEHNACLFTEKRVVAQYGDIAQGSANRGLEGLAVRSSEQGSTVAVLWEGGYPKRSDLRKRDLGDARRPFIIVHNVPDDATDLVVGELDAALIYLDVERPSGDEPDAVRFRASDLVWDRGADGAWTFIVLLPARTNGDDVQTESAVLQRFNLRGERLGKPILVEEHLDTDVHGLNWEGLDWLDDNTLVMVNDHKNPARTFAATITLPADF